MIETKPMKVTIGAIVMWRASKMFASNAVSVDAPPLIRMKPMIITAKPIPNKIKLVLPKAKFLLSILFLVAKFRRMRSKELEMNYTTRLYPSKVFFFSPFFFPLNLI